MLAMCNFDDIIVYIYTEGIKYIAMGGKMSTKGHYLKDGIVHVKTPKKITERILTLRHDLALRYIPVEFYVPAEKLDRILNTKGYTYAQLIEKDGNIYRFYTNMNYIFHLFPEKIEELKEIILKFTPEKVDLKVISEREKDGLYVGLLGVIRPSDDKWRQYYWYIRAPRYITHQYVRHTTFAIIQESMRRRKLKPTDVFHTVDKEVWELAYSKYLSAYESGTALEQARASLPVGTMSTMVVCTPEFALKWWLGERLCIFAQKEHRWLAQATVSILLETGLYDPERVSRCRLDNLGYCPSNYPCRKELDKKK